MKLAKNKPLSSREVEDFYQLKKGRGRNYVEFDVTSDFLV